MRQTGEKDDAAAEVAAEVSDETEDAAKDAAEDAPGGAMGGAAEPEPGATESERGEWWGPWGNTFSELQDAVGGLVDGALRSVAPNPGRIPRYDLIELPDAGYRVLLDLPGLEKGDVEVTFKNRELTIAGERSRPSIPDGAEVQHSERIHGRFRRSIRVPGDVDPARIGAKMKDGVLEVTLPLVETGDAQTIRVD